MKKKESKTTPASPQTIEEYEVAISELKKKMEREKIIYYISIVIIALIFLFTFYFKYTTQKNSKYTVINANNIVCKTEEETGVFDCSYEVAYTKDEVEYYKVKIGSTETIWKRADYEALIGENTKVETTIYKATFTNKDKYIGYFIGNKASLIRYSIKGESAFKKEEIEAYKPYLAYYFTNKKGEVLSRKDKEDYKIELSNLDTSRTIPSFQNLFKEKDIMELVNKEVD